MHYKRALSHPTAHSMGEGLEFGYFLGSTLSHTLSHTLSVGLSWRACTLRMFSLDKLKVYDRAMESTAHLSQLATSWSRRHAVVDQLLRASESVVLNIAEGVRLRGTANIS